MATIGLDKLYYSKITEDSNGQETYSTPLMLAKAITAGFRWNWLRRSCTRATAPPKW